MLHFFKDLDKKIFFIIVVCVITTIIGGIYLFSKKANSNTIDLGSTEIFSFDEALCLTIPNRLELKSNRNTGDFVLDLYSDINHIYVYCTSIQKTRAIDLLTAVSEDKSTYLSNKTNIRETSNITKFEHTYPCYEYSFKYLDTECNEDFYCNVVWYEIQDCFYILNFEAPSSNCDEFKSLFDDVKRTLLKHSIN